MNYLKLGWDWLVKSSSDPAKMSLTVRSFLLGLVPLLTIVGFDNSQLPQGIDFVVGIVEQTGVIVAGVMTMAGLVRKLHTTFLGTNKVLKG